VGRGKRLISSIYWLMSCSDCSDMVIVWKKRSKKNGKISRKEEGRGQWRKKNSLVIYRKKIMKHFLERN
jgi:hypothetical protein